MTRDSQTSNLQRPDIEIRLWISRPRLRSNPHPCKHIHARMLRPKRALLRRYNICEPATRILI